MFDFRFLLNKFKKYGLEINRSDINFLHDMPIIDLHSIFIMMNDMRFKGSGLDNMTGKAEKGSVIPELYKKKDYDAIEKYVKQEAKSFLDALLIIFDELKKIRKLLK